MKCYTLRPHERIKSPLEVSAVYSQGKKVFVYPIMAFYELNPSSLGCGKSIRVAFSVPKRRFKRAVDRNYLKRLMREAYRLQKPQFLNSIPSDDVQLNLVLIYNGKIDVSMDKLKLSMADAVNKIIATEIPLN
ncbi:MAG: ribonuclease P protein component [Schleiferiaceae bacterium]|nr:ribonuclease P protein component [Schleiferiaceae bacterium]